MASREERKTVLGWFRDLGRSHKGEADSDAENNRGDDSTESQTPSASSRKGYTQIEAQEGRQEVSVPQEVESRSSASSWRNPIKDLPTTIVTLAVMSLISIGSYFYSKTDNRLETMEKTIARHHGVDWDTRENIIEVGKLLERVSRLEEELKALDNWAGNVDKYIDEQQTRAATGYAHITLREEEGENIVLENRSNAFGGGCAIDQKLRIKNLSSGNSETIEGTIVSSYEDLENDEVAIQVNRTAATRLNFVQEMGKLRVELGKISSEGDKWRPLARIKERRM